MSSTTTLRRLIGTALVDREFCEGLMNGKRSTLLAQFDLSDEEREVLTSLETGSVQELVGTVHSWLKERGSVVSPHPDCNPVHVL